MIAAWRIELFGGLRVVQDDRTITRFRTQKTAVLLAYLAYHFQRSHPRAVLTELLWPECDEDAGRSRLSIALSSLRHQLEPPGVPAGAVIQADRASVGLNPAVVTTDVAEFEAALQAAEQTASLGERSQILARSVDLYRGGLLPGYYDEWVLGEQQRLAEASVQALQRLVRQWEREGDWDQAILWARRTVSIDPLREELHHELMRLFCAAGKPWDALRQYQELERLLRNELEEMPSAASSALARKARYQCSAVPDLPQIELSSSPAPAAPTGARRVPVDTRRSPPMGTVTFLFTDIDGSSSFWERGGEPVQAAVAKHHDLLRGLFRHHGGSIAREEHDSFVVAFQRAGDALACAIAGQQALAAHQWPPEIGTLRVRMALHTGDVEMEAGEYRDPVLRLASRMVLAAHGGQILCSEVTAAVLRRGGITATEPGASLSDLGVYRLRNTPTAERLFQVEHPGGPEGAFPPLKAEAGRGASLPLQLTRFFGREKETAELRELLLADETRLVTLTGPGGSGKTRLSVEVARQMAAALQGAVWFVPLADLSDPRLIPETVRDALREPASPYLTPLEQAAEILSAQSSLLVLDNFEHLVVEGAAVVRSLLERAPTLKCLVTSRQRLDLDGERELLLLPLPVPAGAATPQRLTLCESVQLFVDRAQAVRPDFQVTAANAPTVAALCQRLEGIPLAIELAAARAQVLTPAQMLAQLERRFEFLVSRRRDAAARHRTLRAAIDWGFQLLAPELQHFFARLSVFRGGWDLAAAEAVCEQPLALDYLAQLRECSLLVAEEAGAPQRGAGPDPGQQMRFRMLETVREFAGEQFEPGAREALEQRHAEYYMALAESAEGLEGAEERNWLDRLEADLGNMRAAIEWGLRSDPPFALRLAVALGRLWWQGGYLAEGQEAVKKALRRETNAHAELRLRALELAGDLANALGDYTQATTLLEGALAIARERADQRLIAGVLHSLGNVAWQRGHYAESEAFFEETLGIWKELGEKKEAAGVLSGLAIAKGFLLEQAGHREYSLAVRRSLTEESLALFREIGCEAGVSSQLHHLGMHAYGRGDYATAHSLIGESLMLMRKLGLKTGFENRLLMLGRIAHRQGEFAVARTHLKESLSVYRRRGNRRLIVECLYAMGELHRSLGRGERAAQFFGAAKALQEAIGFRFWLPYEPHLEALRKQLGDAAFAAAWDAGQALTWQEAADEALAG